MSRSFFRRLPLDRPAHLRLGWSAESSHASDP